jgi:hypothetical protein
MLGVRFRNEEKTLIEKVARNAGQKPSEWARNVLLAATKNAVYASA